MKVLIRWIDIERNRVPEVCEISDYRREKIKTQNASMYERNMACEYLLREALGEVGLLRDGKLSINCNEYGKPCLNDLPIHFNISHSGSIVACAVAQCELGLDIQKINHFNNKLAEKYFSEKECSLISSSYDKDGMFTLLWAAKESYIKAQGKSLAKELAGSPIIFEPGDIMSCNGYRIYSHAVCDYKFCCCPLTEEACETDIRELAIQ